MTQTAPDHLPFALPHKLGLRYHGLVTGGQLALPVTGTLAYQQPDGGFCLMVQHGKAAAATVTDGNYVWANYALISGALCDIGGQHLGYNRFIYCDTNYSWVVHVNVASGAGSFTVTVTLEKLFGVFSDEALTFTPIELASATFVPVTTTGGTIGSRVVGNSYTMSANKTGSTIYVNVGTSGTAAGSIWPKTFFKTNAFQHDLVKVTISGNGAISGAVGSGISAVIESLMTAPGFTTSTAEAETTTFAYAICPDGDVISAILTEGETNVFIGEDYFSEVYDTVVHEANGSKIGSFQFGSARLDASYSFAGIFDTTYCVNGTYTINGTDYVLTGVSGIPVPYLDLTYTPKTAYLWYGTGLNLAYRLMRAAHGEYDLNATTATYYHAYNVATGDIGIDPDSQPCWV